MKKLYLLFFIFLLSGLYYSQTTLVNYQFENNLNADVGSIGSPNLLLVNPTNFNTTYATGNPGLALTTNAISSSTYGGYIKLTIATAGYTNITVAFDGYGSTGTGNATTYLDVFANKTGANPSFSLSGTDYVGTLTNVSGAFTSTSGSLITSANPNFDNSASSITIYIAAYNGANQSRTVRIDNLKITGCKMPAAPSSSSQTFCAGATVSNLVATGDPGSTFSWYTAATGGTALTGTTPLSTGTYYVSQTNSCGNTSSRTAVLININPGPSAIGGGATTVCAGSTTPAFTDPTIGGSWSILNGTGSASINPSGVVTGITAGTVSVVYTLATGCSTSKPLTVQQMPAITTNPGNSSITAGSNTSFTVTASSTPTSYQWQVSTNGGSSWTTVSNGGVYSNATTSTLNITGATLGMSGYLYHVSATNGCGTSAYSSNAILTVTYCSPSIGSAYSESTYYIKTVNFIGNITNSANTSSSSASPKGYQDFTGLGPRASQAQGEGVNIFVDNKTGTSTVFMKVWVDWGKDGSFDDTDLVYQCTNGFLNTTFGFQIPSGTTPGDYRIRFRTNRYNVTGDNAFSACGNIDNYGETEDYLFTVIENCAAKITSITNGTNCGPGVVTLNAVGTSGTTEYRWYTSPSGGSYTVSTTPSWTTPSINSTTTYYVTAFNGSCESLFRTPVTATIKKIPTLTFATLTPEICGENSIPLSAASANEQIYLIDENFEGTTNVFVNNAIATPNGTITDWQVKTSTYVPTYPTYPVWYPAISSGFGSNKFMMSTSDLVTGGTTAGKVNEALELKNAVNTTGFVNLTMSFKIYFSSYYDSNDANTEGVFVETNSGSGWSATPLVSYLGDEGIGTSFVTKTINLSGLINVSSLKIRIRYRAGWCDGVAVDDIKLFGDKPLTPSFTWNSSNPIEFYSDIATTTSYVAGTPAAIVYIKPTSAQMESYSNWDISATAILANGCTTSANLSIKNSNKVWNSSGSTGWNLLQWKPTNSLPDLTKCVIVKTPVVIPTGGLGLGKEVYVQAGGTLNIQKDAALKVQDGFFNNAGTGAVVIESDGGLIQINEGNTINTGNITAQRTVNLSAARQQYNYLGSPLEGQNMKTVYNGINYVLYYNESNNYFYSSSGAYIKGRGLAVKEPTLAGVATGPATATFTGYPTNGAFTYPLVNSNPAAVSPANTVRGFNLVANPYPSNIDLNTLYSVNSGSTGNLSSTFYLWDSTVNDIYVQQGSNYGGQSYGLYNAADGTGTAATGDIKVVSLKKPKNIVKMGQAFMVRSKTGSSLLQFNNTIRTNGTAVESYFGKNIPEKTADRYWLKLVSPTGMQATAAVVYFAGGNNGIAEDDSYSMGGSDAISSVVEGQNIAINGRSSFVSTDTVPLATAQYSAGMYTIGLEAKEGIFESQQAVYLKDLQTGTITNLSEGDYTFAATAGASTGRFEVIYEPGTVLATNAVTKEDLMVYRDGGDFVIKSPSKKITALDVYDAEGRLVYQTKPNTTVVRLENSLLINGMYILKIGQNETVSVKKIIK